MQCGTAIFFWGEYIPISAIIRVHFCFILPCFVFVSFYHVVIKYELWVHNGHTSLLSTILLELALRSNCILRSFWKYVLWTSEESFPLKSALHRGRLLYCRNSDTRKCQGNTDTALGLTKLRMWFRNWRPVKIHWCPHDCHLIAPRSKTLLISLLVLLHSSNLLRPDFLCDFLILYLLSLFKSHHVFQAQVVAHSGHYCLMSIGFSVKQFFYYGSSNLPYGLCNRFDFR